MRVAIAHLVRGVMHINFYPQLTDKTDILESEIEFKDTKT